MNTSLEAKEKNLTNLLNIAYNTRGAAITESIKTCHNVLEQSELLKLEKIKARAEVLLGLFYMITGNNKLCIEYSQHSLKYFTKVKDIKNIADAKYNIASAMYKTNNFYQGLSGLLECENLYKTIGDTRDEAKTLKAAATVYEYLGDIANAKSNYFRCIDLAKKDNDLALLSNVYNPLSGIYLKNNNPENALDLADKSINIKKEINDLRGLAFSLYAKAKVFLYTNNFSEAINLFKESLELHQQHGDKLGEGMTLNKLGIAYLKNNKFEEAEDTLHKAFELSQIQNIFLIEYKAQYSLYLLYKAWNLDNKAMMALEKYTILRENLNQQRTEELIKSHKLILKNETLKKNIEIQKKYYEALEKKNQELDSFFLRISHDLKGPLNSMKGLHELVNAEISDPASLEYFNIYNTQINRMDSIVKELITLARIGSNTYEKKLIDFEKIVQQSITFFSNFENYKNVHFHISIDREITLYEDRSLIQTVLQNLIENAIKYSKRGVKNDVEIIISLLDNQVSIVISDNGIGISLDDQEKIFNMFYRASQQSEGSGLGLYILKRSIEKLKGTIFLESEPNIGSKFTVLLPLHDDENISKTNFT